MVVGNALLNQKLSTMQQEQMKRRQRGRRVDFGPEIKVGPLGFFSVVHEELKPVIEDPIVVELYSRRLLECPHCHIDDFTKVVDEEEGFETRHCSMCNVDWIIPSEG